MTFISRCINMAACRSSQRRRVSSVSAIFFDLDNTLIETRKADKLACEKLSTVLQEKYNFQKDEAASATQKFLKNFRLCPDNGDMNLDEWRLFLWVQALGDTHANIADDIAKTWLQLRYKYLVITPEINSLLCKLKSQYLLGLITNGPSRAQWEKVDALNLSQYFDCILVSGDLLWEKPDQNIFFEACHYLGVEPCQCLMVGDNLDTDIAGGQRASLGGTVWIPLCQDNIVKFEDGPQPDFTLEHVTDLPLLLPGKANLYSRLTGPGPDDCNSNASDGS